MALLLVGLSHRTAPVELREQVAFTKGTLPEAVTALVGAAATEEAVILSTCNRTEVYATCEDGERARRGVAQFLGTFHGIPPDRLEPHLYIRPDADSVRHLFRVAAGLDSLVVGEPQILGQVKDAYLVASEQGVTGATLNKLFHWSFAVGKRVRTETGLGEGAVSVSYAAVSLARKIFGELGRLQVLILGAGEMAKLTAQHLAAQQVGRMIVISRTIAHADALAREVGGLASPWDELDRALAESDIVVTATGSTVPVLTAARISTALRARRTRPLFFIDIAVPRDVAPEVGELDQVFLYNIDDLQAVVESNLARRAQEMTRADSIVEEETGKFLVWLRGREAVPTVVALRQRFESIRQAELRRLEPKLSSLPPEARGRVDEITRLIVEKLLLTPTEQLKSLSDRDTVVAYADVLNRLFSLWSAKQGQTAADEPGPPVSTGSGSGGT